MNARFNLLRAIKFRLNRIPPLIAFMVAAKLILGFESHFAFIVLTAVAALLLILAPLPIDIDGKGSE